MAMERTTSAGKQIEPLDFEKALQLITYKMAMLESDIVIRHRTDKNKVLDDLVWRYHACLFDVLQDLQGISIHFFQNTPIHHVKPNLNHDEIPLAFRAYLCADQNMAHLVCYEILSQPSVSLSLIKLERWILILKIAFERNDFFIASSVISALRSVPILKSKLEDFLSPIGRGILTYFEELMPNKAAIFQLQQRQFENGEEVVPVLSSLTKMMDGFEQKKIGNNETEKSTVERLINKEKNRMSMDFVDMQERLKSVINKNTLEVVAILSRIPEENILGSLKPVALKIDIDMSKLSLQIKLYDRHDWYYVHLVELKSYPGQLNFLANYYKGHKSVTKGDACFRKCMGIKNIIQDVESSFQVQLENIRQLASDPVCKSSKKITSILRDIEKTLENILTVQEKRKWQGSPHARRGSSGLFQEKQHDSLSSDEKSLSGAMNRKTK